MGVFICLARTHSLTEVSVGSKSYETWAMEQSRRVHAATISALNLRGKRPAGPLLPPFCVFHFVCPSPGTDPR